MTFDQMLARVGILCMMVVGLTLACVNHKSQAKPGAAAPPRATLTFAKDGRTIEVYSARGTLISEWEPRDGANYRILKDELDDAAYVDAKAAKGK